MDCSKKLQKWGMLKECTDWLNRIDTSRLKKIFMVHGEKDSQEFFKKYLEDNGYKNVQIVKYGETYDLD